MVCISISSWISSHKNILCISKTKLNTKLIEEHCRNIIAFSAQNIRQLENHKFLLRAVAWGFCDYSSYCIWCRISAQSSRLKCSLIFYIGQCACWIDWFACCSRITWSILTKLEVLIFVSFTFYLIANTKVRLEIRFAEQQFTICPNITFVDTWF